MSDWLITPYYRNAGDATEAAFNVAHNKTRRLVENSYGIVKERFPCLNLMRLQPEEVGRVIMAAATLHNITTTEDFMIRTQEGAVEEEPLINYVQQHDRNGRLQQLLAFFRR